MTALTALIINARRDFDLWFETHSEADDEEVKDAIADITDDTVPSLTTTLLEVAMSQPSLMFYETESGRESAWGILHEAIEDAIRTALTDHADQIRGNA